MAKADEARVVFNTLCRALDNMQWKYDKEERTDGYVVFTSAVGKDLTMKLAITVDADRQVIYLKSPMPFRVPQEMRDDVAKALIFANWSMLNGSFEMDYSGGLVSFKIVIPYMDSMLSVEVFRYMIIISCQMIDKFNDKLQALAQGKMTLQQFREFADNKQ